MMVTALRLLFRSESCRRLKSHLFLSLQPPFACEFSPAVGGLLICQENRGEMFRAAYLLSFVWPHGLAAQFVVDMCVPKDVPEGRLAGLHCFGGLGWSGRRRVFGLATVQRGR